MTPEEQKKAAEKIAAEWKDRGYEKGETRPFPPGLLRPGFSVSPHERFVLFEQQLQFGHTSFIDPRIPSARIIIEQKRKDAELNKTEKMIGWFRTDSQFTNIIKRSTQVR